MIIMTVRSLSDIGNVSLPQKKTRYQAVNLEELRGFEFLDAVAGLSKDDIRTLDAARVTFISNQLNDCIKNKALKAVAILTTMRVIEAASPVFNKQGNELCKLILDQGTALSQEIGEFANRLFINGDPLFKNFSSLSKPTYAKLLEAILSGLDAKVVELLKELNLRIPQSASFVLFDLACLHLKYETLHAFLLHNPYLTANACHHVIINKNLSSDQKLDLIVVLSEKGVDLDKPDDTGWTPLSYAITHKDGKILNFLLPRVYLGRQIEGTCYIQRAIGANFVEGLLILSRVLPVMPDDLTYAIQKGHFQMATVIAKLIEHKWTNIKGQAVKWDEQDPSILEKCKTLKNCSKLEIYKKVCENPAIYSMEYLSSLRDQFTNHYTILTKRVSHAWGIEIDAIHPETGILIRSAGNSALNSLSCWLSFLHKFEDTHPEAKHLSEQLKQVFHASKDKDEFLKIEEKLEDGKIIICVTGYSTHTTYSVLKKSIMLYANRGGDSHPNPGISIYDTPDSGVGKLVEKMVMDKQLPKSTYFSEEKIQSAAGLSLLYQIELSKQKGPFCTLDSLKAASFAILLLSLMTPDEYYSENEWEAASIEIKPTYKILTTEYRLDVLKGLLLEVEDFLQKKPNNKQAFAFFYYQNLLAILSKLEISTRWDKAEKKFHGDQIKFYLNLLADLL